MEDRDSESIAEGAARFASDYVRDVTKSLATLSLSAVGQVFEILWRAYQSNQQILIMGNGGSASTASHLAIDLAKGALGHRGDSNVRPIRALSLANSLPAITAWANDVGFDAVFLGQLRAFLNPGDVVIAISASGNSPNILKALTYARKAGAVTIGLSGFGGGALVALSDHSIVVDSHHYGVVEDVHLQICHMISYYFRERLAEQNRHSALVSTANPQVVAEE